MGNFDMNAEDIELPAEKVFPFHRKSVATRIERLSVSHRNGDHSEVQQILGALKVRGQKITHGFESFVSTRSDLEILKALEPILLVINPTDISLMERVLLKHSKFNLTVELLNRAYRIHDLHLDNVGMNFASFSEMCAVQPIENFYFAIDYLHKSGIELRRVNEIFVFENFLMMSDSKIISLIETLKSHGIEIRIKKPEEEIDSTLPASEKYRIITPADYQREDWYASLNNTPWLKLFREILGCIESSQRDKAYELLKEFLEFKNSFPRVVNVFDNPDFINKIDVDIVNGLIMAALQDKEYVSAEPFVHWWEIVSKYGETKTLTELTDFAKRLKPESQKTYLALDMRAVDNLLESREWKNINDCVDFLRVLKEIQTYQKPTNGSVGYFLLNCDFASLPESVVLLESELDRNITKKEFSLGLSCFEVDFNEERILAWLEFGKKRDFLDDREYEKIYKIGLVQLNSQLIKYAIDANRISLEKRSSIRHQLLRFELSSGSFENGKDLFELCAHLGDTDVYDPVLLVQSSQFERFSEVESIVQNYFLQGHPIDEKTIGSLCNRYSRNDRYEDVLRVLDSFSSLTTRDDTILDLYRLASLANLQREKEALSVFDNLVKSRNQFLIQKYAPSILKKIENDKLVSIASALNFELKNVERPVNTRKLIEASTGIIRNRNLPLEIKKIYGSLCQVCKVSLATPFGLIAEAAHIQGLGHPHYGSDDITNLLCLCPNHHKLFDSAGWYLSDDLKVVDTLTTNVISELLVVDVHQISLSAISYQRNYAINASSRGQRAWS